MERGRGEWGVEVCCRCRDGAFEWGRGEGLVSFLILSSGGFGWT